MLSFLKGLVKSSLRPFGYKIKEIQVGERNRYGWLAEHRIGNVIDIGANIGQYATEIHSWLPAARIDSFEPLQDVYRQLTANVAAISQVTAHNCALGKEDGVLDMQRNEFTAASSIREMTDTAKSTYAFACTTSAEQITVRRLDGLVDEGVVTIDRNTLVKIDVQGYEAEVIGGGRKALSQAGIIICEVCFVELYKGQALFRELVRQIEELGFELRAVWDIDLSGKDGFPVFGDAIFFRRDV